ncbi:MAG: LytTR family transcriptional regulator [Clostridiales bacterium]|nr:LytTR family transcriptional regulator [Clostridiales bacterium]
MFIFTAYVKDPKDLQQLKNLLQEISWKPSWKYQLFTNWRSLLQYYREHPSDLQLVLIDMDEDAAPAVQKAKELFAIEPNVRIIFCGPKGTDIPALYEADHLYFLYRPFLREKLAAAMEKGARALGKGMQEQLHVVNQKGIHSLSKDNITFIEKNRRMVHVHTGDSSCSFYGRFSELEPYLDSRFCQCHQSYIVNLYQVRELEQESLTLKTGERIPVSKNRKKLVRTHYEKFIQQKPYWQKLQKDPHK